MCVVFFFCVVFAVTGFVVFCGNVVVFVYVIAVICFLFVHGFAVCVFVLLSIDV